MFIINLAVSDFLMCFTQAPVVFASSLYKRWLFGEAGGHSGSFCGRGKAVARVPSTGCPGEEVTSSFLAESE